MGRASGEQHANGSIARRDGPDGADTERNGKAEHGSRLTKAELDRRVFGTSGGFEILPDGYFARLLAAPEVKRRRR